MKKIILKTLSALATVGIAFGAIGTSLAYAPESQAEAIRYFKYPWWNSKASMKEASPYPMWSLMTEKQWVDAGSPALEIATFIPGTIVRKYPLSDDLYAFFPTEAAAHKLTPAEYKAMNYPVVQMAPADLLKYSFCGDIYAQWSDINYVKHVQKLTPDQWGKEFYSRMPNMEPFIDLTRVFTYPGDPSTVYAQLGGCISKVDKAQLAQWQNPPVEALKPTVEKFSWSGDLFAVSGTGNMTLTTWLDQQRWAKLNNMVPKTVKIVPGTTFYYKNNKIDIYAGVGGKEYKLTVDQWASMGKPEPTQQK